MRVYANTISVLFTGANSINCYVRLGRKREDLTNYANVTVRFDRGAKAEVCGYPQSWGVYDCNVEYYNYDSPTFEELDGGDSEYYVDRETEVNILKGCMRGIIRQYSDPMFKDNCSGEYRQECLNKILN